MAILPSHKNGILYLEHCAVRASDDRLAFVRRKDAVEQHFSIPLRNTAVLLLGPGTSITQQAARLCAEGQLLLGLCAGGGTPVYLAALNEYREPLYSRQWIRLWSDEVQRLCMAQRFQQRRCELVLKHWTHTPFAGPDLTVATRAFDTAVREATSTSDILSAEAHFTKQLYSYAARSLKTEFVRAPKTGDRGVNDFLDASNYLAYGLAACCLWVLGIPHSYPVVHGKTRRGALVFDVADIVKDALVLPHAFLAAAAGEDESACRRRVLAALHEANALATMFESILEFTAAA